MSNTSTPAVLDMPQPRLRLAVLAALLILTDAHAPTLVAVLTAALVLACGLLLAIARSSAGSGSARAAEAPPRLGSRASGSRNTLPSTRPADSRRARPSCVRP